MHGNSHMAASLMFAWHTTFVLVYEIVLHIDIHDTDATNLQIPDSREVWKSSTVRTDLLLGCLEATKASLDYFLQLTDEQILPTTMLDLTRTCYGLLVLGKLSLGGGLAHDDAIIRERSNLMLYFDALVSKYESLRTALGGPNIRNFYFHSKRVMTYTKTWFENALQQEGVIFDGSSGLRDSKDLAPLQILDDGQEAIFIKGLRNEAEAMPPSLDNLWDEIMKDYSAPSDDVIF